MQTPHALLHMPMFCLWLAKAADGRRAASVGGMRRRQPRPEAARAERRGMSHAPNAMCHAVLCYVLYVLYVYACGGTGLAPRHESGFGRDTWTNQTYRTYRNQPRLTPPTPAPFD